jgi:hypothetical protein
MVFQKHRILLIPSYLHKDVNRDRIICKRIVLQTELEGIGRPLNESMYRQNPDIRSKKENNGFIPQEVCIGRRE